MRLKIVGVDYAPDDLYEQVPFTVNLIREMKGVDRPDYWLAKVDKPITWESGMKREISYVILASRLVGTTIKSGMGDISLGLAYVVDETLLQDNDLDFNKCKYVAICASIEIKE